jgi:hypothetical protein
MDHVWSALFVKKDGCGTQDQAAADEKDAEDFDKRLIKLLQNWNIFHQAQRKRKIF